jgi:hypothetical protein
LRSLQSAAAFGASIALMSCSACAPIRPHLYAVHDLASQTPLPVCLPQYGITQVVRVMLREPFDPRRPQRDVTSKPPVFVDEEDLNNLDGVKNHAPTGGSLDINLAALDKGAGGYARIRFIKADVFGKFDFEGSGLSLNGAANPMGFCGPRFVEIDANNRLVAELFVKLHKRSGHVVEQDLNLDFKGEAPGRYWGPRYLTIRVTNNAAAASAGP